MSDVVTRLARPDERQQHGLPPIAWCPGGRALVGAVRLTASGLTVAPDLWDRWPARSEWIDLGWDPLSGAVILAPGTRFRLKPKPTGYRCVNGTIGRWLASQGISYGVYSARVEDDWLVVLTGARKGEPHGD